MLFFVLACVAPAFLISVTVTGLMRRWAPHWGLIDQPAARKMHRKPTPLGGGIGIWAGVVIPLATAQAAAIFLIQRPDLVSDLVPPELLRHLSGVSYRAGLLWAVLAAGTLLSLMGFLDDLRNLPWQPRLLVQALIAFGLAIGGVRATVFVTAPWFGIVLTAFWILVLINSFNFLDNMDGLSSGIALIAASLFAVIMLGMTAEPRWLVAGVLLILAGSLGGFLCHNWSPARIFMGDTGSYFIGLLMATMTVLGTFYDESSGGKHVIFAPFCVLAIPLYDFTSVVLIRLFRGRSPFHPDKNHFSHRLVDLGLSPKYAVLTVHLATLTTGLSGLILYQVADWRPAALVIAMVACVLGIIAILEFAGRRTKSS